MLKLKSVNFEQQQFQIHCLDQAYNGQVGWTVGRNPTCDVVLRSPDVSRVHGRIIYSDDTYHFVDIGSTSGSLLNGEAVPTNDKRSIRPGDLLQLGEIFLYVEELSPPSLAEVAPVSHSTPLLPERYWTEEDLLCRCCRIVDETPDVKTFSFVADPPVLFTYKPGQFVNLELEIEGKTVLRPYSLSSSPTRPYHLSLTIKRVPANKPDIPPGLVSNWLHDHLQVGDKIKLRGGALGNFTCLPHLPTKLLLISAGSGITPMMSMSRWVQDTLANCDIVFLHSARTPEDIVFRAELESMAAQMPNFHLAVTTTRQPVGQSWMGLTGRVSKSMLHLVAPDLLERSVYVCGSTQFMQDIRSTLEAMNFPMQHYQEESFGDDKAMPSPSKPTAKTGILSEPEMPTINYNGQYEKPKAALNTVAAPIIHFAKSGQDVMADGNTSILELAEQEGIEIRHACRVGACGACKVVARQGKVRYDTPPSALTSADQEAGYVLACVAYPVDRLVVEA